MIKKLLLLITVVVIMLTSLFNFSSNEKQEDPIVYESSTEFVTMELGRNLTLTRSKKENNTGSSGFLIYKIDYLDRLSQQRITGEWEYLVRFKVESNTLTITEILDENFTLDHPSDTHRVSLIGSEIQGDQILSYCKVVINGVDVLVEESLATLHVLD